MNRTDLQQLAEVRVREAECLLQASLCDGAYYLAGYAVECALKACIAKQTREHDFPDRTLVNKSYTHDLEALVGVAGLQGELNQRKATDPAFAENWALVAGWSEEARYQRHDGLTARQFCSAVADPRGGVLEWLKAYW